MAEAIRVFLFNQPEVGEVAFRAAFEGLENLNILGEFSSWDDLREHLGQTSVDIVAINLDEPDGIALDMVQAICQLAPGTGIIGISQRTDPATIIGAMRAGCNQFVCRPVDTGDLRNAIERIRATQPRVPEGSKRIYVIGSSGGAGATTIACHLAMELAHVTGRRAALVDLNLEFGDVACAFDCTPRFSVADVCGNEAGIDAVLVGNALHELPCNVSLLARPQYVEQAREVTPGGVDCMFKVLAEMFPYVVVDLPRAYSVLSAASLREAHRVLIVTQLGVSFIRNATRIYEALLQMGSDEGDIEIVLNRCKGKFERISARDVEAHFKRPIFAMIPNDYQHVQTALDLGHPMTADAPRSPANLAIRQMAQKLAADQVSSGARTVSPGFLARFWRRPAKAKAL